MKEKKQTKQWSYSTSGKAVRGLLCMITFCVFMAGLAFSAFEISQYGDAILWETDDGYYNTANYASDLKTEAVSLIYEVDTLNNYEMDGGMFSVIDVGNNSIYYYDVDEVVAAFNDGGMSLESLESYRVKTQECDYDFTDLPSVIRFLESDEAKGSYIYLDSKRFVNLFLKNGVKNTNYRFSNEFSREAYFVFDDVDRELRDQGFSWDNADTAYYDIENVGYAVYDPEQTVFYSTWDEYFDLNDTYIYSSRELLNIIQENNISDSRMNSIAIPMLWAYNYAISGITAEVVGIYNEHLDAVNSIEDREDSGFLYFIGNLDFDYKNVEAETEITSLNYSYIMTGNNASDSVNVTSDKDVTGLSTYPEIQVAFNILPEDVVFYFGFDPAKNPQGNDILTKGYRDYNFAVAYIWYFLIAAVIGFILLVIQAAWLIRTTGRTEKGAKEVKLIWYDKLGTEIWALLTGGILFVTTAGALFGIRNTIGGMEAVSFVVAAVTVTLPFAFAFMVLTLSFARRIKSNNLLEKLYLRKLWGKMHVHHLGIRLKNNFKAFYRSRKDTEKILVIFLVYLILEFVSILLMWTTSLGFILFGILQITALAVVYGIIKDIKILTKGVCEITKGNLDYKFQITNKYSLFRELNDGINHIGDGLKTAVETSLKDERMKTELITNVSHDLKTPLTSIINYVDLLKKEEMPTKEAAHYLEVLESKSLRLKQLTEDLVEAAKANSGNIELEKMPLAFDELMKQAIGEFEDKFNKKNLTVIAHYPEKPVMVMADGRRMFRIIENVLQNAYKYALEGTRIYAELSNNESEVTFILKNVSAAPLNISPDELVERFTRGDESRTTEGSGLGLSIAKDLTKLHDGTFNIVLDGDLFKVIITFPEYTKDSTDIVN